MQHEFWHQRWQENKIGFHLPKVNANLLKHVSRLQLTSGAKVFVPLSGKSNDLIFLQQQGYDIVANELSQLAVTAFFTENKISYANNDEENGLLIYQSEKIKFLQGDFFALKGNNIGHIDALYDRAALIALPKEMRILYVEQIKQLITTAHKILLVTLEYQQDLKQGPPFSVTQEEVNELFQQNYDIQLLDEQQIAKDQRSDSSQGIEMLEKTYLLKSK